MLEIGNIINHPSFRNTRLAMVTEILDVEHREFRILYKGKAKGIAFKFPLQLSKPGKEFKFVLSVHKESRVKPYMSIEDLNRSIYEIAEEVNKLKSE